MPIAPATGSTHLPRSDSLVPARAASGCIREPPPICWQWLGRPNPHDSPLPPCLSDHGSCIQRRGIARTATRNRRLLAALCDPGTGLWTYAVGQRRQSPVPVGGVRVLPAFLVRHGG